MSMHVLNIESNFKNLLYKNRVFSLDPHNPEETIPSQNPNLQKYGSRKPNRCWRKTRNPSKRKPSNYWRRVHQIPPFQDEQWITLHYKKNEKSLHHKKNNKSLHHNKCNKSHQAHNIWHIEMLTYITFFVFETPKCYF